MPPEQVSELATTAAPGVSGSGGHDERLRRTQRLRHARDFQGVRRRGRRQNSAYLTLSYARRPVAANEPSRVAFVTSKKVGNAVARNRVRRWLREAIRRRLWHVAPGWDMIISARPGAAERKYATLDAEVAELLARAHLFTRSGADTHTDSTTKQYTGDDAC